MIPRFKINLAEGRPFAPNLERIFLTVLPRRESPSGHGLLGREISMGKKSAAVALPELLDLIDHCREAPRPAL